MSPMKLKKIKKSIPSLTAWAPNTLRLRHSSCRSVRYIWIDWPKLNDSLQMVIENNDSFLISKFTKADNVFGFIDSLRKEGWKDF